jgi:lipopolysaccharide transport system permease protein
MVPARYQHLIVFNPMAPLMISWRNMLLKGQMDLSYVALSLAYALAFLGVGYVIYRKLSWKFAEVL